MAVPADDANDTRSIPLPPPPIGDDLRIKPALAAMERAYISAAMTRANGNQTVAARLLGLSRFGLQKKLRRLASESDVRPDAADTVDTADSDPPTDS